MYHLSGVNEESQEYMRSIGTGRDPRGYIRSESEQKYCSNYFPYARPQLIIEERLKGET
jgi:hypothetical protein